MNDNVKSRRMVIEDQVFCLRSETGDPVWKAVVNGVIVNAEWGNKGAAEAGLETERWQQGRKLQRTVLNVDLEIQHDRGVIYAHITNHDDIEKYGSMTALRICRLPTPIPAIRDRMLDITHMHGTDWGRTSPLEHFDGKCPTCQQECPCSDRKCFG